MANGKMTERILKWARAHDWGQQAELTANGHIIGCREVGLIVTTGERYDDEAGPFATLKAIRAWAGY